MSSWKKKRSWCCISWYTLMWLSPLLVEYWFKVCTKLTLTISIMIFFARIKMRNICKGFILQWCLPLHQTIQDRSLSFIPAATTFPPLLSRHDALTGMTRSFLISRKRLIIYFAFWLIDFCTENRTCCERTPCKLTPRKRDTRQDTCTVATKKHSEDRKNIFVIACDISV